MVDKQSDSVKSENMEIVKLQRADRAVAMIISNSALL